MKTEAQLMAENYLWFGFSRVSVEQSDSVIQFIMGDKVLMEVDQSFFEYLHSVNIYDFKRLCSFVGSFDTSVQKSSTVIDAELKFFETNYGPNRIRLVDIQ